MIQTPLFARILFLSILISATAIEAAVLNIKDEPFSAIGNGKVDDGPAFKKALESLKAGDTLVFPPGEYRVSLSKNGRHNVPAGATLLGHGESSKIVLVSDKPEDGHREFLRFHSDTTLEGLSIIREGDYPLVMFPLFGDYSNITLQNCTIDGNKVRFPKGYCHAIQVGSGTLEGLSLRKLTVQNCSFGLFQANSATGTLKDVLVDQCLFQKNWASDLEFNSPNGKMDRIVVRDSVFRDNQCKTPSAGFAVGFANVTNSRVENCLIRNCMSEALHVEDRSENIQLTGNTIVNGSSIQNNGVILIVNDSKNIVVENNVIDARDNTNRTHLILVTAGGANFPNPSGVVVRKNVLLNGPETRTWYLQPGSTAEPEENVVVEAPGKKDAKAPAEND